MPLDKALAHIAAEPDFWIKMAKVELRPSSPRFPHSSGFAGGYLLPVRLIDVVRLKRKARATKFVIA
jgi:hypothetical protein